MDLTIEDFNILLISFGELEKIKSGKKKNGVNLHNPESIANFYQNG